MNLPEPTLSQLSVRIKIKNRTGSGFLYIPNKPSPFIYIFTAKHCIYGDKFKNRPRKKDIVIFFNDGQEPANFEEYRLQESDSIIVDESNDPDLAAIQIYKKQLNEKFVNFNSSSFSQFSIKESKTIFKGFPQYLMNEQPRSVEGVVVPHDSNEKLIRIAVNSTFNTQYSPAEFNVKGFSGSGLCVELANRFYLIGIVYEYEKAGNRFHCCGIKDWLLKKIPGEFCYSIESERILPLDKFQRNLDESIKLLGPRFSKEFTFQTPIFDVFKILPGGANAQIQFYNEINTIFQAFESAKTGLNEMNATLRESINRFKLDPELVRYLNKPTTFEELLNEIEGTQARLAAIVKVSDFFSINFREIKSIARTNYENSFALYEASRLIKDGELQSGEVDVCFELIKNYTALCEGFLGYIISANFKVLISPYLLISGEAGTGKSHLLADITSYRIRQGCATFLFLGQNFLKLENPWDTILTVLDVSDKDSNSLLELLNEKGKLLGERVFIFIDAINEGAGLTIWKTYLESFLEDFEQYPYVGLVLSYRTTYRDLLFPTVEKREKFIEIEHRGFAGYEIEAFKAFAQHYQLKQTNIPILSQEFRNPLFLKLLCIGIKQDVYYRPGMRIGIERVFRYFIKYVNEKLSEKYDYDFVRLNLVQKVIDRFAKELVNELKESLNYERAYLLVEDVVSKFLTKRRFLDKLIDENIFVDSLIKSHEGEVEFLLQFSYQRLGDHMIAKQLLSNLDINEVKSTFHSNGIVAKFISKFINKDVSQGVLEAIAIQFPSRFNEEILNILPQDLKLSRSYLIAFLKSLSWRTVNVSRETLSFLYSLLFRDYSSNELLELFWDTNIELSLDETNTFNGDFLHEILKGLSIVERDAIWTIYLQDQYPEDEYEINSINRLLRWAWKSDSVDKYPEKTVLLGAKTITWFFTSTNRGLRDLSTKALIYLFHNHSELIIKWVREFENINDPYVVQRVYAVVAGCVVRIQNNSLLKELADYIYNNFFNKEEVLPDILSRDYTRLIIEFVYAKNISKDYNLDKIRPPYYSSFPDEFPSNEQINTYRSSDPGIKSILSSMITEYGRGAAGYGDFGRYKFERALKHWRNIDINLLGNLSVEWIFEKYEYDANKFGAFDSNPSGAGSRINSTHKERIGKKYQWLTFHEMMARVADNKPFHPDHGSKSLPKIFKGAWEPFVRDIDPTFVNNPYKNKKEHWLKKLKYKGWSMPKSVWMKEHSDLPKISTLIEQRGDDLKDWFILQMSTEWFEGNQDNKEIYFRKEQRRLWLQLRSYLTRSTDYKRNTEALEGANFWGRWMPESNDIYELYNREYFWSPASNDLINTGEIWSEIEYKDNQLGKVVVTATEYLWEAEYDNSKPDGPIHIMKPSKFLHELLNLEDGLDDGEYIDELGNIVCIDPSVKFDAPSCLLVRKDILLKKLKEHKLNIFWTLLGEKQVLNSDDASVEISALIKRSKNLLIGNYYFF